MSHITLANHSFLVGTTSAFHLLAISNEAARHSHRMLESEESFQAIYSNLNNIIFYEFVTYTEDRSSNK